MKGIKQTTWLCSTQFSSHVQILIISTGVAGLMASLLCTVLDLNKGPNAAWDLTCIIIQPSAVEMIRHLSQMSCDLKEDKVEAGIHYYLCIVITVSSSTGFWCQFLATRSTLLSGQSEGRRGRCSPRRRCADSRGILPYVAAPEHVHMSPSSHDPMFIWAHVNRKRVYGEKPQSTGPRALKHLHMKASNGKSGRLIRMQ